MTGMKMSSEMRIKCRDWDDPDWDEIEDIFPDWGGIDDEGYVSW